MKRFLLSAVQVKQDAEKPAPPTWRCGLLSALDEIRSSGYGSTTALKNAMRPSGIGAVNRVLTPTDSIASALIAFHESGSPDTEDWIS